MLELAERIARIAHRGQAYGDGGDYVAAHVAKVVANVAATPGAREVHRAAAWLHDVIEDTNLTAEDLLALGVPEEVVRIVLILTKRKGEPYFEYIARVKLDADAVIVKRADLRANCNESTPARLLERNVIALTELAGTEGSER